MSYHSVLLEKSDGGGGRRNGKLPGRWMMVMNDEHDDVYDDDCSKSFSSDCV